MGAVRSMLAAGQDGLTRNAVLKSLSALPGIGNGFRFAEEVVLSCGILVKNCVGIAGVICILVICLLPILKIFAFTVFYRLLAAFLQLFSDKRIVNGVWKVAGGCTMYLKIMVSTMLLFLIDLALLTFTTTYT
jgi:stage III sporulation protein AE